MPKYKVVVSLQWEIESSEPQKVKELAESHIAAVFPNCQVTQFRLCRQTKRKKVLGEFTVPEVLPYITSQDVKREFKVGATVHQVRMNSDRYIVFRTNLKCVSCALEGTKFLLEQHPNDKSPHFNLYGEEDGKLVLLTKDHIQAKSVGGEDLHSNYQTMCAVCNNLKGNDNLTVENISKLRKIYDDNKDNLPKKKLAELVMQTKAAMATPRKTVNLPKAGHLLISNCDIDIIETKEGLIGISSYEHAKNPSENHIASIKRGTFLDPHAIADQKILFRSCDKVFAIHQGLVETEKS
jgi:hypothetical protein